MSIPIVFYHDCIADRGYIFSSLMQARRTNRNSRIILLVDEIRSGGVTPLTEVIQEFGVEVFLTKDFRDGVGEFIAIYKHLSSNPYNYELVCFVRWFVIRNFVKEQKFDKLFVTDSDVLLFCDISMEREKTFANFRITLTHNVSAGISFINDVSVLDEYCKLCMNIFSGYDKYDYDKCYSHFVTLQNNGMPGGVCDMTIWGIYRNHFINPGLIGETSVITPDFTTFDHNVNVSDSFEMDQGTNTKRFIWIGGTPYCRSQYLEKEIKFNCIHFQGPAKRLMDMFYREANPEILIPIKD